MTFTERLFHAGRAVMAWFVPEPLASLPEEARRARLVVMSSLLCAALSALLLVLVPWRPLVAYGPLVLPGRVAAGLMLNVVLFVSSAFVVRRTQSWRSAAAILAASIAVMVSFLSYFSGGFHSPVLWWLVALPLFAALIAGPTGALQAAMITTPIMLTFYLLDSWGHPFPVNSDSPAISQLRGQLSLLAFFTILGWYYERDRLHHARHLTDAYAHIEAANRALQYSQLHVRQIAENIGQAIWMYDVLTQRVVYANTSFESVWQIPRSQLADNPKVWVARVHPEDIDVVPHEADAHDHVYRIVRDDGEEQWIRHAVYPVTDPGSEVERVIHIAADITIKKSAETLRERFLETVLEVQEKERKHLARELHDETGQSLTALLVGLKALDGTLQDKAQRDHVHLLRRQLSSVIKDIGRLARGLHPAVLDELGLEAAVTRLAHDVSEAYDLKVTVRSEGFGKGAEERLPRDARLTVYRITQEALTNVIRHAHATEVDVTVTLYDDEVNLRVEDDGKGFDPSNVHETRREIGLGLGVMSMRERASLVGGNVSIESAPGMGTTVLADIPLFPRMTTAEVRRTSL